MVILRCYLFVTGGRNGVEWVASLLWNQWPEWSRMGGRNGVEYAIFCGIRYNAFPNPIKDLIEQFHITNKHFTYWIIKF